MWIRVGMAWWDLRCMCVCDKGGYVYRVMVCVCDRVCGYVYKVMVCV